MSVVRLVRKAKKGNREALLQLILAEKDDFYRLALTYMGNPHDAMDAVEDMIVKLFDHIHQLKKDDSFYSWSKTILVNQCKSMLRRQKRVVLVDDWSEAYEDKLNQSTPDFSFQTSENRMDIESLLTHLNEHQKEAIQLKYFHDLEYEAIAEITQVPIGTVKSRIFQALKKLREYERSEEHGSHRGTIS
jgi:RNA polymerase sigma factor (sigma-70 family)